eukprot:TRINITY_DN72480_c0_g1_i1.p1 TRINITY_DN72480_c0_g1~~TRINITY_DN72480_c0_g1_i1.p1  ORF type:complete len:190 (-),score=22.00 TRINITY_DN72480_c0_g1_i1:94-663(-)
MICVLVRWHGFLRTWTRYLISLLVFMISLFCRTTSYRVPAGEKQEPGKLKIVGDLIDANDYKYGRFCVYLEVDFHQKADEYAFRSKLWDGNEYFDDVACHPYPGEYHCQSRGKGNWEWHIPWQSNKAYSQMKEWSNKRYSSTATVEQLTKVPTDPNAECKQELDAPSPTPLPPPPPPPSGGGGSGCSIQ